MSVRFSVYVLTRLLFVATVFGVVLPARAAIAHPLGNFTVNHLTRLTVAKGSIDVRYVLDLAEIPTVALDRSLDSAGRPTAAQYAAWGRAHAREIAPQLDLRADGTPLALSDARTSVTTRRGAAGLRILSFTADFHRPLPPGVRSLTYVDRTEAGRLGWRDVVLTPATEPTDGLRQYPSALVGSPRARISLAATIDASGIARRSADPQPDGAPPGTPSLARMNALSDLLAHDGGGPLFLAGALLLAIGLGALHALEPGHGKTLLAVSLVGARATSGQALILAGSLTVAHTIGVLVLGAIVLFATRWIVPEAVYPWITLGSGILVAMLGARALAGEVRRRRPIAHGHVHRHDHAHPHAHDHAHGLGLVDHDHASPHAHPEDLPAKESPAKEWPANDWPANDRPGNEDWHDCEARAHARGHAVPGTAPLTFRTALIAAASGNLAPCPAALVVLLAAISLHRIALGMTLILAFSLGLAATLTLLGVAVVRGAAWLAGRRQLNSLTRWAPFASAGAIALVGAVMVGDGLVAQGVPAPLPVVAGLTFLGIVGYAFTLPHRQLEARMQNA